MQKVQITPVWTIGDGRGNTLAPRILSLLSSIHSLGSLADACKHTQTSYRHAWNLLEQAQSQLGAPLLHSERGKGSQLTALGEKLVWADHRIHARLGPLLETLASELEVGINQVLAPPCPILRIHASHGFAIEKLLQGLTQQNIAIEKKYMSSLEAAASLHQHHCDAAGFHIPIGEFESLACQHYAPWWRIQDSRVIHIATRRQGLMVAPGNPLKIYEIKDLARTDIRFINRQRGAGTRFLLECLCAKHQVNTQLIAHFEEGEYTHAAVAAFVASGMADVGFGLETPARSFQLDFIPIAAEQYFLLCHQDTLKQDVFQTILAQLQSPDFQAQVQKLPGYSAENCGLVRSLPEAFPSMQ